MPTSRLVAALLAAALTPLGTVAARAQAQTGTGDGPGSTLTAPNTSTVGRTKPPGAAAAGTATAEDRRARTPEEKQDDKIQKGICIGCGAK